MGRSNGYRPTKANEVEVMRLRARLGKVRASEWQKASCIMQQITTILGKQGGPGNGMISPRACTVCGFFGHTKQWCKVRLEMEADSALAVDEDRVWRARNGVSSTGHGKTDEVWCAWYAWAWRRYEAARAAGGGDIQRLTERRGLRGLEAAAEPSRGRRRHPPESRATPRLNGSAECPRGHRLAAPGRLHRRGERGRVGERGGRGGRERAGRGRGGRSGC